MYSSVRSLVDSAADYRLVGEQKMCYSLPWTPMNRRSNLTPLALASAEKSVTVHTQKNKQTTNSKRLYLQLAYRHEWIMSISD